MHTSTGVGTCRNRSHRRHGTHNSTLQCIQTESAERLRACEQGRGVNTISTVVLLASSSADMTLTRPHTEPGHKHRQPGLLLSNHCLDQQRYGGAQQCS
jgi:hypothetical protein